MSESAPGRHPVWWWAVVPLPSILLFLPHLIAGRGIAFRDTTTFIYVLRRWHWQRILEDGQVPLWNDHLFNGLEHVADPQVGLYSPFSWLYLLFDGTLAHDLYLLLLLCLGALGMALFLRELLEDKPAALALGAFYPLTGVVLSTVTSCPFLAGVCLFPWALWAGRRLLDRWSLGRFAALVLLLAWPILEGDPFGTFWMSGYLAVRALLSKARWRAFSATAAAGALAALLAAPAWLPAFDTLGQSVRSEGIPLEEASTFSLAPGQFLQLVVPGMWGRFFEGTFSGHALVPPDMPFNMRFWHDSLYLGVPFLCLLCFGAFLAVRRRRHGLLLAFGLLYTGIALGTAFFLHPLLHWALPFYARLRFPAKFFSYAHMFLFPLAGVGLTHLRAASQVEGRKVAWTLAAVAGVFVLAFGLALGLEPGEINASLEPDPEAARELLSRSAWTAAAFGAVALLLLFLARQRARLAVWGLFTLGAFDLWIWAPALPSVPLAELDRPSRIAAALRPGGFQRMFRNAQIDKQLPWVRSPSGREALRPDWGVLDGVRDVLGYAPTFPARFDVLKGKLMFDELPTFARMLGITHVLTIARPGSKILRRWVEEGVLEPGAVLEDENLVALAVRPTPAPFEVFGGCVEAASAEEALAELRARGAARDAAVVEPDEVLLGGRRQPREERPADRLPHCGTMPEPPRVLVEEKARTTRSRRYALEAETGGLLVIRDTFHPGWEARIDGRPVPITRADFVSMAVVIAQGDRELALDFEPQGYRLGNILSLVTLGLGALACLTIHLWRRRRS